MVDEVGDPLAYAVARDRDASRRLPKTNPKGCSTCTRRRIRCDLGQPTCNKCSKKGLDCPGYGPRLRWAGGVAVRGRLKGQNVPVPEERDGDEPEAERRGAAAGGGGGDDDARARTASQEPRPDPFRLLENEAPPERRRRRRRQAVGGRAPAEGKAGQTPQPQQQRGSSPPSSSSPPSATPAPSPACDAAAAAAAAPDLTLRKSARAFIEYYDRNIAGLMVWFDTEDNDYRRRVLPLAANAPGLRLAVAAISAHHGGLTFDQAVPRFSEAARDACLGLIQTRVRDMTGRLQQTDGAGAGAGAVGAGAGAGPTTTTTTWSEADIADAEWMLAAILIISTYEMANAQAAAAESHRMAARTIVNVFGSHVACRDRVFDFLRNQMSILDILSSTTSFDLADVERAVMPPLSMANGLFTQFLTLLHRVTLVSRRRMSDGRPPDLVLHPDLYHGAGQPHGSSSSDHGHDLSASAIRSQFQQATSATLLAAGRLQVQTSVVGRDFIRLVHIYHHAAILYSYRSLGHVASERADWEATMVKLFEQLSALEDAALCAQNLPWPAFVAGTECHADPARQAAVAALFALMTDATGFRHFLDVLHFLRLFWAGPHPDWRPLARDLQHKGFRILAV